jgi:single-stranded-DNA-specific exonuclease
MWEAVARARGCSTPEEIANFLDSDPVLHNPIAARPEYLLLKTRLEQAKERKERIVIYGDYDCDGITALVQTHDFLKAAGFGDVLWFIPDRMTDDYGLTASGVQRCVAEGQPNVLIAVDCGSNSHEIITDLQAQGIAVLVVDHHAPGPAQPHPASAHFNPKTFADDEPSPLAELSAAGLIFLLSEQLARDWNITTWDRERALLLAALGTVADVMPMRRINRAIVKQGLHAIAHGALAKCPGLQALHTFSGEGKVTARTFGFVWGPRINANGRLEDASRAARLLLTHSDAEAAELVQESDAINRERQGLQREVEKSAMDQARARLAEDPACPILILADRAWHSGVVGIVAARIKERYHRPVVVCGWHEDGYWKGSARSMEAYDIGAAVRRALDAGVVERGGGHRAAAGVGIRPEHLDAARAFFEKDCHLTPEDFHASFEILASVIGTRTRDARELAIKWVEVLERLEPFGAGNPEPQLLLEEVILRWGPKPKQRASDNLIWAWSAGFEWTGHGLLFADWYDVERAEREWRPDGTYTMVVSPYSNTRTDPKTGVSRLFSGWRIRDCTES